MKLLYLIPGVMQSTKLGAEDMERRRSILQEHAFAGTQVDVIDAAYGPESIESLEEEYTCVPGTIERALEAEAQGYDGIILGCFADPGIGALRELLSIPVVGPFEASCMTAATLGYKFSIITTAPATIPSLEEEFFAKGLADRKLASVRAIDVDVLDVGERHDEVVQLLLEEGRAAVEKERADCLVLGCISLAFAGADQLLEQELGVPVVNPILVALHWLEGMVEMRLAHSKKAYPIPRKRAKGCC